MHHVQYQDRQLHHPCRQRVPVRLRHHVGPACARGRLRVPLPRSAGSEDPPCERSGAISVLPAVWDRTYDEPLIFATDWAKGDEEEAKVQLTLTKSGSPDIVESITVTIEE